MPRPEPDIAARVGILLFEDSDTVNAALAEAVAALRQAGLSVGGLLQRFGAATPGRKRSMWLDTITGGPAIRLDQDRGPGAGACRLDEAALAEAGGRVRDATRACAVMVFPRFGSLEAEGGGLRHEMAEAVLSGAVVLIGTRPARLPDLERFLGAPGTILAPSGTAVAGWAADMVRRDRL